MLAGPKILTANIFDRAEFLSAPVLGGEANHTRPTLKIQDGCNLRCSYCVIPFVRGKSRSMPPSEVVAEIRRLTESGYKEIVLSGINLGTWGRDLTPRVEFEDLLRRILDETDVARLRISSIEPLDVTADLIALFASTPRIAQHFHMPLQSGSDKILAAMHRWYRSEHYARRVELIREQLPARRHRRRRHRRLSRRNRRRPRRHDRVHRAPPVHLSPRLLVLGSPRHRRPNRCPITFPPQRFMRAPANSAPSPRKSPPHSANRNSMRRSKF